MNRNQPRKLHRGHFAFMRALAQGLDERASWDRYLRLEGEHADLRTVRRTIAWIRDAFAAAARRERRPGTARLILLDPDRYAAAPALPSLAEFAAAKGLEDFSEAEQIEAYQAAHPAARGGARSAAREGAARRARVIERQLAALRWLEGLVAQDPRPGDNVGAWLNPAVAVRLDAAGLPTLFALVERINGVGARWWVQVPGVGQVKAARILDWLRANEDVLGGLRVGRHVALPRRQLSAMALAEVVPAATSLLPLEKFVLPAELDGSAGRFRAPREQCRIAADDDRQAIRAWLAARDERGGERPGPAEAPSATQRAYRKEAERLLLWAVLERNTCLSSLDAEDAEDYLRFLRAPPSAWCGPRHHQRWSPLWRPLEGPLTPAALRQAVAILRSLYGFLQARGYLLANPFAGLRAGASARSALGAERRLSFAQWDRLEALLARPDASEVERRLRRGMRWLYATGLRLAEITAARCEHIGPAGHGAAGQRRLLSVTGKAGRQRQVAVPEELVRELEEELRRHGFAADVAAPGNRGIAVLARFGAGPGRPRAWSASGLHQAIKRFLAQAAERLPAAEAKRLRQASAHWLRHSHGTHALRGREGRAPVALEVVQNNLGHVSAATTVQYMAGAADASGRIANS